MAKIKAWIQMKEVQRMQRTSLAWLLFYVFSSGSYSLIFTAVLDPTAVMMGLGRWQWHTHTYLYIKCFVDWGSKQFCRALIRMGGFCNWKTFNSSCKKALCMVLTILWRNKPGGTEWDWKEITRQILWLLIGNKTVLIVTYHIICTKIAVLQYYSSTLSNVSESGYLWLIY